MGSSIFCYNDQSASHQAIVIQYPLNFFVIEYRFCVSVILEIWLDPVHIVPLGSWNFVREQG